LRLSFFHSFRRKCVPTKICLRCCRQVRAHVRLYDPVLGRFLGMDPYVQIPDFTQNFNRYSYCLNNPLIYTDPDGEFFLFFTMWVGFFKGLKKDADGNRNPFKGMWNAIKNQGMIYGGLFKTDTNKNGLQRLGEFASRFTLYIYLQAVNKSTLKSKIFTLLHQIIFLPGFHNCLLIKHLTID